MALTQIQQAMLVDGILTADAAGRLKVADGFVNTAKVAADAITNDKRVQGIQVFTTVGTSTFTVPANVTKVKVTVVGGGGGGACNGSAQGSNAGAAGATAIKYITGLTPGATVSVTVGGGGAGSLNGTGGTGGTSSFGAYCSATGGNGGNGAVTGLPSVGGTATGGDINVPGAYGGAGSPMAYNVGGVGGNSFFGGGGSGGGGGSSSFTSSSAIPDANAYGGGGGGLNYLANNTRGGNGYQGVVIVEY